MCVCVSVFGDNESEMYQAGKNLLLNVTDKNES